jgi:hypothetical protein
MSRPLSAAHRAFTDQLHRPSTMRRESPPSPAELAALACALRGWPIFPVREKRPLTSHGRTDASRDPDQIRDWFSRWPDAEPALATGQDAGIVALDVDISPKVYGPDSLAALGVVTHPETPTSHTPRGGFHCLFRHPGHFVKSVAGKLGDGLDIRGDGGSITLPPGPGRFWDPVYGPDYPIAPMPEWMIIPEPAQVDVGPAPRSETVLSRYGEAALDSAVNRIIGAPAGQQEMTLNSEVFGIARLAGGGGIPTGLALDALLWAARKMPSHDPHRPWRAVEVEQKVRATFAAGIAKPRMTA